MRIGRFHRVAVAAVVTTVAVSTVIAFTRDADRAPSSTSVAAPAGTATATADATADATGQPPVVPAPATDSTPFASPEPSPTRSTPGTSAPTVPPSVANGIGRTTGRTTPRPRAPPLHDDHVGAGGAVRRRIVTTRADHDAGPFPSTDREEPAGAAPGPANSTVRRGAALIDSTDHILAVRYCSSPMSHT